MPRAAVALWCTLGLAAGGGRAVAQNGDSATTSIRTGAYTVAQARGGEAVFRGVCAECHALAQFREPSFLRAWTGRTARDLFEMIRTQMPQDNPGRLRRDEYAAVLAYIFELNGYPPGDSALASDDAGLARVRIDQKPTPVPPP